MEWSDIFEYSHKTGDLFWKFRQRDGFNSDDSWRRTNKMFAGKRAGAEVTSKNSVTRYRQFEYWGKAYKCHRVVWQMHFGEIPEGMIVDHINGNGLDNRIENLRIVDQVDSSHNKPIQKSNTLGIVGVNWHKSACAWQARISMAGKRYDLGRYSCLIDAVAERLRAEREFGYHENHGRPRNEAP